MDPDDFASTYGKLLTQGKGFGLEGSDLTNFITQGMSTMKGSDLESAFKMFSDIRREERDPAYRRQVLQDQLEFDKERMKEAGKYKLLFGLPETITSAFTTPGLIAAQGANTITNLMAQGAANIPQLTRFDRGTYSYSPSKYFG